MKMRQIIGLLLAVHFFLVIPKCDAEEYSADFIRSWYPELAGVERFRRVIVTVDSVNAVKQGLVDASDEKWNPEKFGLISEKLSTYARLRFANNFAGTRLLTGSEAEAYDSATRYKLYPSDTYTKEREILVAKTGYIGIKVWVIGDEYPLAYHISAEMRYMRDSKNTWSTAYLGYGSAKNIEGTVKEAIDKIMEDFAQAYLKARGVI